MGSVADITGTVVYLDTNIFIYAVEDVAGLGSKLRPLFERFDRGELHAVTSELALAEVLVKPLRDGNAAAADSYSRMLRSSGSLTVWPVERGILVEAARLRAAHPAGIKLPDAIHAATAVANGCTTFLTNDQRFETIPDLPVLLLSRLP